MDTLPGKIVLCSGNDILKHPQSHNTCYIEMHITQIPTLVLVLRISASTVRNNRARSIYHPHKGVTKNQMRNSESGKMLN